MSNYCSPDKVYNKTCFSLCALKKIARTINNDPRYSSTPQININEYNRNNKTKLINDIQQKLSCRDNLDFCILNKKSQFYKEIKEYFKPSGPGKNKWLSTLDIKGVMEQYMLKYPNFIFYGPVPLDFSQFYEELRNINLKTLNKGKKKVGIVFNLDYSYQSGSHWVSLFLDLENKTLCYFDSSGDKPPKEIKKLINDIVKSGKNHGIKINKIINENKHQYKDTECGIYSIYFLVSRLQGKSCNMIFDKIIKDDEMKKNRNKYFIYK